jgi:phytoene dehydrogenase-like protein
MTDYDVILIGGNTSALSAAAYLGKDDGLKTLIIEKTDFAGAACMTKEFIPGFKFHPAATGEFWLNPVINKDLGLDKRGVEIYHANPKMTVPFGNGKYISLFDDVDATCDEIGKFSKKDAAAYKPFMQGWLRIGEMMGMGELNTPMPFSGFTAALSASHEMEELMKGLLFGTVRDTLDQTFENPYVKAAFLPLMEGSVQGPSAAPFFFSVGRFLAPWGFAKGGLVTIANAMREAAEDYGAKIMLNKEVVKILVRDGKACGVKLASGEEITARVVITELEPAKTFIDLVGEEYLQPSFVQQIKRIKYEPMGSTLNLALDRLPDFGFPESAFNGFFGFYPSYEYGEKAFYEYATGEIPEKMCMLSYMQSYFDPSIAPAGKHVLTAFAFPLPYDLKQGDWPSRKEEMLDKFVDSLAAFDPHIKSSVIGREGYTPYELEQKFGMTKGDIQHGSIRWGNQLSFRPMVGWSNYRSPITNLYMSGATTHPGAGITGVMGHNTAMAVLEDLKKSKK